MNNNKTELKRKRNEDEQPKNKKQKLNGCSHTEELIDCFTCKQRFCQLCFNSCYYCEFNKDVNFDKVLNNNTSGTLCRNCMVILPDEMKYYCEPCKTYYCSECIRKFQGCPWDFSRIKDKIANVTVDDKTYNCFLDGNFRDKKEHSLIQIKLLKCNNR